MKALLGVVGRHYGFGRDDLLDTPVIELNLWCDCIRAAHEALKKAQAR